MFLKFNRDEISPLYVPADKATQEVAKDLASFWLDTDKARMYCARRASNGTDIEHWYYNKEVEGWVYDYTCK